MIYDFISRPEHEEWARKMEAQIRRATEVGGGSELIVYDNDALSRKLKVSTRTLQNWRDGGLIKFSQIGKKIYYMEKSIISFLDDKEVKTWGK